MIDHQTLEVKRYSRYLIFLLLLIIFAGGFLKIKSFYVNRISRFSYQIDNLKKKTILAEKILKERTVFYEKISKFQQKDTYEIMKEINDLQDKCRVNIDTIRPSRYSGEIIPSKTEYILKDNLDFKVFTMKLHGTFYKIKSFLEMLEKKNGVVNKLLFNMPQGKGMESDVSIVFIVRKQEEK